MRVQRPVGEVPAPPPPQPSVLGIDDSTPVWELTIAVHSLTMGVEKLAHVMQTPGFGPPLAEVS